MWSKLIPCAQNYLCLLIVSVQHKKYMRKYSANYSLTNHNFVIQNLKGKRITNKYLPAICILKNILQRGKPTMMSEYLQGVYGKIHEQDSFKKPHALISDLKQNWIYTIRGDSDNNYFPARSFFEERIEEDLPEYSFIKQLMVPELPINSITQIDDSAFRNQRVDFYLPMANLVIEIDGQQHKEEFGRVADDIRDKHLAKSKVVTVRIDTHDLERRNDRYYDAIEKISIHLKPYHRLLAHYKESYENGYDSVVENTHLRPTATVRFQVLILELLENGYLSLEDSCWRLNIKNTDVSDYEEHAIEDLFEWFNFLLKLQKIDFNEPTYKINNVSTFNNDSLVNIDFSLLKRWTDEANNNENIIYVRTDYQDLYDNRETGRKERVNYFRVSTTNPFSYHLEFGDNPNVSDLDNLKFFLLNIFGYDEFNPGQVSIIKNALEMRDTIGLLPTGGGKSLTYQLTALLQPCIGFVVCPIKSLMHDQLEDLKVAHIHNVETITGDLTGEDRGCILDNYGQGKYFFVLISPERFQTKDFRTRLSVISNSFCFSYAVIDEVHCLSEWGHDFRLSYLNLSNTIKKYCRGIKFLGLTATASVNVLKDIQIEFNIKQENVKTLSDYTRPELDFVVIKDKGDKYKSLTTLLNRKEKVENIFTLDGAESKCGLIFTPNVNGKKGCYELATNLSNQFLNNVKYYSGSKPKNYVENQDFNVYKKSVQNAFKENKFPLMVATKAFGMGINKRNIRYTIHYGIPSSMESLYQEAGRAGRDKKDASCYVLLSTENENENLEALFHPDSSYEDIAKAQKSEKWDGKDVYSQIFLYQSGVEPIEDELKLICKLHSKYSEPSCSKLIHAKDLGSNKLRVEKCIYRLSNLGVIGDWTVEDFFGGVFTVHFTDYEEKDIQNNLLRFIRKYVDDFVFDAHSTRLKYSSILSDKNLSTFESCVKVLLQWSYDKFGANRRESLKNVYYNCLKYDETPNGRNEFKESLEAYFKFTDSTYVLQEIADNNNKKIDLWFSVFYQEDRSFIDRETLVDLEGSLQRFLESYQTNTGLNLLNGLTLLLLSRNLTSSQKVVLDKTFSTILLFDKSVYSPIMKSVKELYDFMGDKEKGFLFGYIYKHIVTDKDRIRYAKFFGHKKTLLDHYNNKLKEINRRIENGLR